MENRAQTTSNLKDTTSLNRCIVILNKLSEAELKRICNQKTAHSGTGNNDCGVSVETRYHTGSSIKPKPDRQSRLPQIVSANVSYEITSASSDVDRSPTAKKCIKLCPKRERSSARIKADNFVTKPPPVTPLHRSARNLTPQPSTVPEPTKTNDSANPATPSMSTDKNNETAASTSSASTNPNGDFKTQSFGLKHSKKPWRFRTKMCDKVCDSIHELSVQHQQSHNILYCDACTKAFNNPALLACHKYVHQESKFQSEDCDQSFPFESTLKSHRISHCTLASYFCSHANCTKKFKNKEI